MSNAPMPSPPGWYPDPQDPQHFRWFSGTEWTSHTSPVQPPHGSVESWMLPVGRPWQAIVAGYSGLIGIVIIFLMPASLGFGIWGLQVIKRQGSMGKRRCWFGIVSGVWNLVAFALIFASR